jgi:diguanylate cyclase (GGDEF)-like protein
VQDTVLPRPGSVRESRLAVSSLLGAISTWLVLSIVDHHVASIGFARLASTLSASGNSTRLLVAHESLGALIAVACAAVVGVRARTNTYERDVWSSWACAIACLAGGFIGEVAITLTDPASGAVATGTRSLPLEIGTLLTCMATYRGLTQWNRVKTLISDPSDWLNGVGSVFAMSALGNVVARWAAPNLFSLPWWQVQGWLICASTMLVLVGTTTTVAFLGGLLRDLRVWLIATAFVIVLASGIVSGAQGSPGVFGTLPEFAWLLTAVTIAACALREPAELTPVGATVQAPVVGAVVVLGSAGAILIVENLFTIGDARVSTLYAVLAVLCASTQAVHIIRGLSELAQTRLEARSDELTGVANRRELLDRLRGLVATDSVLSLLVIDLDRFKDVNDRFGHAIGDELLRRTCRRLQTALPADAVLARLGGDEFAVLLTDIGPDEATKIGAKLVRSLTLPMDIDGCRASVGASIGIGAFSPSTDAAYKDDAGVELLRRADMAMYLAKRSGGAVSVYDTEVDAASQERSQRLEELRTLLAPNAPAAVRRQLRVYYQPQVDAVSGQAIGAEALVRWQNPRLGLLMPAEFLDLVEDHGLMGELTSRVLHEATAQAVQWRSDGHQLRMSVNLSPAVLASPDLLPLLDAVLRNTPLDPTALTLEITETSLMSDPQRALHTTQEIAARGIVVSIDDFGTGYSSLAYLNDLPATELKLDQSFIGRVVSDERTAAIVAGSIELAHHLGARVTAEGVEDIAALNCLRDLGCDTVQGYLYEKPVPAADFLDWLVAHNDPTRRPASIGTAQSVRT